MFRELLKKLWTKKPPNIVFTDLPQDFLSKDVLEQIQIIADTHGWGYGKNQTNIGMVSYFKAKDRINIYTTTMTVATCINHPKKGKTQLFRKNVSIKALFEIFKNPRIHTGKGYYTKN